MIQLIRTDAGHPDFHQLVAALNSFIRIRDGEELHTFYAPFNQLDQIKQVVVAYVAGVPAGCGAFKPFAAGVAEIKRMFTDPAFRGQGVAFRVLAELEQWAASLGYHTCVLETGVVLPEAVALYEKAGYTRIPNYGQYVGVDNSICMQKTIAPSISPEN
ncbi:GNAT family N-acetyltransferase [Chitinophaga nivalis]|uniref:GNAT family N-acetyltransferase n=1 Tax=Chitinophaga nivalis TaxID=2991709 RepID=A0ABT3INY1_9BACT|nr:GNAT family N-acetyltransferase [Chitinophaga nivalis]MCW3464628.1 GNAT family N-acetyltransferase [Chitinophaga nivalis]MCW3485681.1 GNAT family N-acetyltransferase [Chitinophaga nivalis]